MPQNKKIWIFAFLFFILISAVPAFDDFDNNFFDSDFGEESSFDSDFGEESSFDSDFDDEFSFDSDFDDEFSFDSDFGEGDEIEVIIDEPYFDDPTFDYEDDDFFDDDSPPGIEDPPFHNDVNRPPVILSTPQTTARIGELYTYQVVAIDPDEDVLSYHVEGPDGMSITDNGLVSWMPTKAGNFNVKVIVTDNNWGLDAQTYTITVPEEPSPTEEEPEAIAIGDLLITKLTIHNEYAKPGDIIKISMNLKNTGKKKMENIMVSAAIQEFAERSRIGPFDLKKHEQITKTLFLQIPEDAEHKEYYIRFAFNNNNIYRLKYRPITIV